MFSITEFWLGKLGTPIESLLCLPPPGWRVTGPRCPREVPSSCSWTIREEIRQIFSDRAENEWPPSSSKVTGRSIIEWDVFFLRMNARSPGQVDSSVCKPRGHLEDGQWKSTSHRVSEAWGACRWSREREGWDMRASTACLEPWSCSWVLSRKAFSRLGISSL